MIHGLFPYLDAVPLALMKLMRRPPFVDQVLMDILAASPPARIPARIVGRGEPGRGGYDSLSCSAPPDAPPVHRLASGSSAAAAAAAPVGGGHNDSGFGNGQGPSPTQLANALHEGVRMACCVCVRGDSFLSISYLVFEIFRRAYYMGFNILDTSGFLEDM
jgi:hypothetical protein